MALTLRTNGTGGGIVSAAWWNDYYSLLTGAMTDQAVTIANTLTAQHLMVSGTGVLGRTTAGDILDIDANAALYLKAASAQAIHFQIPNGTDVLMLVQGTGALFKTLQSGAANGIGFQTWTGTANAGPFSIGGQFNGAASYVDAGGNFSMPTVTAGLGSPTNITSLVASATNAQGTRVARIQNVATSGQNSDMLDIDRLTNQAQNFTIGIDSSNGFYLYDATGGAFVLRMWPDKNVMTNRAGTLTPVAVYTSTSTPVGNGTTTPATGAIWVKA